MPVKEIDAMVMGGHGDTMVPLPRFTKVNGKMLNDLISEEKFQQIKLKVLIREQEMEVEIVKYLEKDQLYAPSFGCRDGYVFSQ